MDQRRAGLEGGLDVEDRRQILVLDVDRGDGRGGLLRRQGGDRGDDLPLEADDVAGEQRPIEDEVERAVAAIRHVVLGQDREDAGQRPGPGGVDADDPGVGAAGEQQLGVGQPGNGGSVWETDQALSAFASRQPAATTFIDAIDVVYDANIPYDLRFFELLNRMVQSEPWIRRDMAMIDQLKTIGIEQGKLFNPDAKLQQALKEGVAEAHAWLDNQYDAFYTTTAEYPGSHWALPVSKDLIKATESHFADTNLYPTDSRGIAYSYAS